MLSLLLLLPVAIVVIVAACCYRCYCCCLFVSLLLLSPEAEQPAGMMRGQLEAVCEALDGVFDAKAILRTNVASTGNSEALVAHYLEAEVREAIGESRGNVGWPVSKRLKQVRGWLTGLSASLEVARQKWCVAEDALESARVRVTEEIALKVLKDEDRRKAFEARWAEVKERNRKRFHEGTYDGPIVPIGLRLPEHSEVQQKKQNKGEAPEDAVPKTFLHLKAEAPEVQEIEGETPLVAPEAQAALEAKEDEDMFGDEAEAGKDEDTKASVAPEALAALGAPEGGSSSSSAPEAAALPPSKSEEVKAKLTAGSMRLEPQAYNEIENEFIAVASIEDLRPEDRAQYELVRMNGMGLCARCRWTSGCMSCDPDKAWGYACRNTLWHWASEAVRPKAKPRGRPKAKGGK